MIPRVTAQRSILLAGTVAGVFWPHRRLLSNRPHRARRYATRGRTGCTDGATARVAADGPP